MPLATRLVRVTAAVRVICCDRATAGHWNTLFFDTIHSTALLDRCTVIAHDVAEYIIGCTVRVACVWR
jgi:hypothetical protein